MRGCCCYEVAGRLAGAESPVNSLRRVLFTWRGLMVAVAVACIATLALISLPPVASGLSREWVQLSRTNQEYQAVSALVSSLALVGIVISLLYQARAGHTAREQSIRSLQQQLIRMEMEDPALMTAAGAPWGLSIPAESQQIREHLYLHMWTLFWSGSYVVGEMSDIATRMMVANELFNSAAGRRYWANVRENILTTTEGRYRRFALIVDGEYQKIIDSNTPVAEPVKISVNHAEPAPPASTGKHWYLALAGAAAIGVLAGRALGRRARLQR